MKTDITPANFNQLAQLLRSKPTLLAEVCLRNKIDPQDLYALQMEEPEAYSIMLGFYNKLTGGV